jgi:hypothetical protein
LSFEICACLRNRKRGDLAGTFIGGGGCHALKHAPRAPKIEEWQVPWKLWQVPQVWWWACPILIQFCSFSVHFRSFIQFVHFLTDKIKNQELVIINKIKLQNKNKNN